MSFVAHERGAGVRGDDEGHERVYYLMDVVSRRHSAGVMTLFLSLPPLQITWSAVIHVVFLPGEMEDAPWLVDDDVRLSFFLFLDPDDAVESWDDVLLLGRATQSRALAGLMSYFSNVNEPIDWRDPAKYVILSSQLFLPLSLDADKRSNGQTVPVDWSEQISNHGIYREIQFFCLNLQLNYACLYF